jgi:hypothetical protein
MRILESRQIDAMGFMNCTVSGFWKLITVERLFPHHRPPHPVRLAEKSRKRESPQAA